jgi:fluoride exporter
VRARNRQPVDPDTVRRHPAHPGVLALVVAGGAVGTTLRHLLESAFGAPAGTWPWVTFWINVIGALALGALLEVLAGLGPDEGWRRSVRLGVGTGVLGGFTTYSTFVVETALLARGQAPVLAAGYDLASLAVGFLAALAGTVLVSRSMRGGGRRRAGVAR